MLVRQAWQTAKDSETAEVGYMAWKKMKEA